MTDSALQASLTAIHVALAFLRRHRAAPNGAMSPFVLPSFLFAATPWIWPSTLGVVSMGLAHLVWFVTCEIFAPPATPRLAAATRAAPAPAKAAPAPKASRGFVSTPVLAVLDEATDIKTFRLARPEGFAFAAGQFIAVRVSVEGKPHVRCYSISSSPDVSGYFEISVRRQGLVSTTLHATLRTGSMLAIDRPAGQFVYPANDDRPLALIAGGIGITPLLAMLRYALSSDPTRPISLLYSARDRKAIAFLNELRVIAERHPQVRIGITLSNDATAPAPWRSGRIDLPLLRQYVPHPAHTVFCVCGPDPMMAAVKALLLAEGVPSGQIHSEQFALAVAAASVNLATPIDRPAAAVENAHHAYRLTFASTGLQASASASQTFLDAAEREGVSIPSSCRSGVCQACRTRLVQGDADCRSSMLDPGDRASGFVLPCVTYALSDCVLDA